MFRELSRRSRHRPPRTPTSIATPDDVSISSGTAPSTPPPSLSSKTENESWVSSPFRPPRPSSSMIRRLSSSGSTPKRSLPRGLSLSRLRRWNTNVESGREIEKGEKNDEGTRKLKVSNDERVFPKEAGVARPLESMRELLSWRPRGEETKVVARVKLGESVLRKYQRGGVGGSGNGSSEFSSGGFVGRSTTLVGGKLLGAGRRVGSLKKIQPPRLMVVHDFAGGYPRAEAKAAGVVGDECPEDAELYRFNHWAYVDIFVYFSHYRVTIPPPGFIDAAHRHGVLVLGTLMFEHDDGTKDLEFILTSFRNRAKAATQLASIAKFYGFDGWLINVECDLSGKASAASDLAAFVSDVARSTRKHVGVASEVVWYDAVTRKGKLKWQNELNEENEQFFKSAGAMLTNYHWNREAPVRSAVRAGSRRTDIFTGVDVFGRGTYGGGGFYTHVALRAIKQGGTSAALFAPGWTVESCPPEIKRALDVEERFWTGPKGRFGRQCVAQYFRERAVVTSVPFSTNFNPGWGPCWYHKGVRQSEERWYNLSEQAVQPSFLRAVVAAGDRNAISVNFSHDRGWSGSGCMHVRFAFSPSRMISNTFALLRLYVAGLSFPAKSQGVPLKALNISYTYQTAKEHSAKRFGLVLLFSTPPRAVALVSKDSKWQSSKMVQRISILNQYMPFTCLIPDIDSARGGKESGWSRRSFKVDSSITNGQKLVEILYLVGDPPTIPTSAQPSPFMTPGGYQTGSRFTSRYAARAVSRHGSRYGSPSLSRNPSLRGSPLGTPPPEDETVLIDERECGRYRNTLEQVRQEGGTGHKSGDFGEDFKDHIGLKSMRVRNESYAAAFMTGGSVDFSALEYNVNRIGIQSNASSRAMSRFTSRFGTPAGASRFGSRFGSRIGSRFGSRAGSRGGSPPRTPGSMAFSNDLGGLPLAGLLGGRGKGMAGREEVSKDGARSSGCSLKVLRTALMQAAGNMAGGGSVVDGKGDKEASGVEEVWLGDIEISASDDTWNIIRRKMVME